MKRIIDGKAYNTETATLLATVKLKGYKTTKEGYATRVHMEDKQVDAGTTSLYQTMGGAYFVVREINEGTEPKDNDPIGPASKGRMLVLGEEGGVFPITRKQALAWAEYKNFDADAVERMFGGIEEAGEEPDRVTLRMPESLKRRIHAAAAASQQSVNAWALRLFEAHLGEGAKS